MSTVKVVTQAKPVVRRLIVGLGNMGSEFHRTRHNVGFAVCRLFASDYLPKMDSDDTEWKWRVSKSNKCSLLRTSIHFSQKSELGLDLVDHVSDRAMQKTITQGVPFPNIQLALSLPLTYMNNSGQSVVLYTKQHNFRLKNPSSKNSMDEILVVHDDISVPFGEVRFTPKGGDGGQNGVKSIIKCMATEKFPRLRIGIGAPQNGGQMRADPRYVIGRWDCTQLRLLPYVLHFACEGLRVYLHRGVIAAASYCNYKNCEEEYKELYPNCKFDHFDVDDIVPKNFIVCYIKMKKRTPYCNHPDSVTCIHCMGKESDGEAIHWMCQHPPGQMCPNCVNLKKGEKVELEFLCQHGPNQYCTNCLNTSDNSKAKHISFEDYLNEEKKLCLHGPNQRCPHCTMPSLPSYKVKKYCTNHPPYPRGLCTSCQPKPCTLARQKYRHVDSVQVVDKKCLDLFVQEWLNYGERTQFIGLLFGRYVRKEGSNGVRQIALVYGLYKPKQRWENGKIVLEKDELINAAESIASALNLVCVGMIYTSAPRSEPLNSFDVDFIAPLQWKYRQRGDYCSKFVSIVISRNEAKQIEPTAFMLSDQCICMYRDGLFLPPTKSNLCHVTTRNKNNELLSSVIRNDAKLGSQEVTEFEPLFFLVELTVTIAKKGGEVPIFKRTEFPSINSYNETKDTLLKELLSTIRQGNDSAKHMKSLVSDFYLLVELSNVIGVEPVIDICSSIINDKPLTRNSMELLNLLVNSDYYCFCLNK